MASPTLSTVEKLLKPMGLTLHVASAASEKQKNAAQRTGFPEKEKTVS